MNDESSLLRAVGAYYYNIVITSCSFLDIRAFNTLLILQRIMKC